MIWHSFLEIYSLAQIYYDSRRNHRIFLVMVTHVNNVNNLFMYKFIYFRPPLDSSSFISFWIFSFCCLLLIVFFVRSLWCSYILSIRSAKLMHQQTLRREPCCRHSVFLFQSWNGIDEKLRASVAFGDLYLMLKCYTCTCRWCFITQIKPSISSKRSGFFFCSISLCF